MYLSDFFQKGIMLFLFQFYSLEQKGEERSFSPGYGKIHYSIANFGWLK
jgi:hypothetical protein